MEHRTHGATISQRKLCVADINSIYCLFRIRQGTKPRLLVFAFLLLDIYYIKFSFMESIISVCKDTFLF